MTKINCNKQAIEDNKNIITNMISGDNIAKCLYISFVKQLFQTESRTLFPKNMNSHEITFKLDYTNIQNQITAFNYILTNKNTPIDHFEVRHIHRIICKDTHIPGGETRRSEARMQGLLNLNPPSPTKIDQLLDNLCFHLNNDKDAPVFEKAFSMHYNIIEMQPFNDFNKRTARLIMNWILIHNDYTPIIFNHTSDKKDYIDAIASKKYDKNFYRDFMICSMIRSQQDIIKVISR